MVGGHWAVTWVMLTNVRVAGCRCQTRPAKQQATVGMCRASCENEHRCLRHVECNDTQRRHCCCASGTVKVMARPWFYACPRLPAAVRLPCCNGFCSATMI